MGVFLEIQLGYLEKLLNGKGGVKAQRTGPKMINQVQPLGLFGQIPHRHTAVALAHKWQNPFEIPRRVPTANGNRQDGAGGGKSRQRNFSKQYYIHQQSQRESQNRPLSFAIFTSFFCNNLTRLLYCNNLCIDVVKLFGR